MLEEISGSLSSTTGMNVVVTASSGGGHITNTSISNTVVTQVSSISHLCRTTLVSAPITNTGVVVFGFNIIGLYTIGIPLYPGESLEFPVNDTNLIYAIATVNGEDINVTYFN